MVRIHQSGPENFTSGHVYGVAADPCMIGVMGFDSPVVHLSVNWFYCFIEPSSQILTSPEYDDVTLIMPLYAPALRTLSKLTG